MTVSIATFVGLLKEVISRPEVNYKIDQMVGKLVDLRERGGRLFVIGIGGGAANAAHAVNDFRKLCDIEAYAPTDGIAELTARANDDGWDKIFSDWLHVSNLSSRDAVMVFSVGGGTSTVSACIARACYYTVAVKAPILGVVGRNDGAVARQGDTVIVMGLKDNPYLTPVTETVQIAVLHALVSDPRLKVGATKW